MSVGCEVKTRRKLTETRQSPALTVVAAVADAKGVEQQALEPLEYVVSVDAVNQLVKTGSSTSVAFEYEGHPIVIDSSDTVTVYSVDTPFDRVQSTQRSTST